MSPPRRIVTIRDYFLKSLAALIFLMLLLPAVAAGPQEEAIAAFESGDFNSAFALTQTLAEQGDALAQFRVGWFYAEGIGTPHSFDQAVEWYHRAAEQGLAYAQYELALLLRLGLGTPKDEEQATIWFREASKQFEKAAEEGNADAKYYLGLMYADGTGVRQDREKSGNWFRKAAEQGHLEAQNKLFLMHAFVPGFQLSPDELTKLEKQIEEGERKAAKELRRLVALGSPMAQTQLGSYYLFGQGVPKDPAKGIALIQEAAEKNYSTALFIMSELYSGSIGDYEAFGMPKDEVQSLKWAILAAEQGDRNAQFHVDTAPNYMPSEDLAEAERQAREWKHRMGIAK
jgi:TPR repeat protein